MIAKAVNALAANRGGVCYVDETAEAVLPLPIAGLMSELPADQRAAQGSSADRMPSSVRHERTRPTSYAFQRERNAPLA